MERAARRRHDDVVGRELHPGGAEQGADGAGVGADLLAAAVDHHRDLGTRRGGRLLDDPGTAEGGEHHEHGDPEHPGSGEEAGAAVPDRRGAGRRALLEEVGDRRELLGAGEGQPGGGVVRFGPGRRRRGARRGHRQGVGQQRLRLGHHRSLVLRVRVEQLVDRWEVVEIVGEREPGGRVVRLGPGGRRRHRGLDGRQIDLGRDLGRGVLHPEDLVGHVGGRAGGVVPGPRGEGLAERLVEARVEVHVDADVGGVVQVARLLDARLVAGATPRAALRSWAARGDRAPAATSTRRAVPRRGRRSDAARDVRGQARPLTGCVRTCRLASAGRTLQLLGDVIRPLRRR